MHRTNMDPHPPEHLLVHPLPSAPEFVGREGELQVLRRLSQEGFHGVLALVGLGGAGKTALAARFLEEMAGASSARPPGLFLWSFYQEPDAGLFLQRAYQYFAGETSTPAKGAALLHLLREALAEAGPHWLVLDGLERVQVQEGENYGQIEDPLLKSLLTRIAEGMGQTVALVTSRFPLTDLHAFPEPGYRHLDVGGLSRPAALALLRSRGVKGDNAVLGSLVESYGAHALTLDHLGGLIGHFLEGDPSRAPELAELADPGKDRQALRLARLLKAYEEHLPPTELAVLCRLCLLRRSVTAEHLVQLLCCWPPVHARTVRKIGDVIQRILRRNKESATRRHRDLDDNLADTIRIALEEALCVSPIAGPEETFRTEVVAAAEKVLEIQETCMEIEFCELAHLYSDPSLETPSDRLPLGPHDRELLRQSYALYVKLREHPQTPFKEPEPALELAFKTLGYGKKAPPWIAAELTPSDFIQGTRVAKRNLLFLAAKHFALRRVRELCRTYQRKWSLAGPLAFLNPQELREVLSVLVGRHLVLAEADGSFSVHPAVRDHFGRLAAARDQVAWHDLLREQLVSLAHRPGKQLPADPATLDLVEEAIHHALAAGRTDEAQWLYLQVLGGLRHLGWKLGEMNRGLRILRGFNPCPERWDLAWYLRALGEFDEAFACNELAYFRADILLLQGKLPQVAREGESTRAAVAAFLMGQTTDLPADKLGGAIPRDQLFLYLGRLDRVRRAPLDDFYREIGWEGDRARCQLLLAEAARRQADMDLCRHYLEEASKWIFHSGSVEHLCLWHLGRARQARAMANLDKAQQALTEGLHVARQCGLELYHIELLCEQAEIGLAQGEPPGAEQFAREALRRASAAKCQFAWGAAQAGHLVAQALCAQKDFRTARDFLLKTRHLRQRIGDPEVEATERLLASLPG